MTTQAHNSINKEIFVGDEVSKSVSPLVSRFIVVGALVLANLIVGLFFLAIYFIL